MARSSTLTSSGDGSIILKRNGAVVISRSRLNLCDEPIVKRQFSLQFIHCCKGKKEFFGVDPNMAYVLHARTYIHSSVCLDAINRRQSHLASSDYGTDLSFPNR